MSQQGSLTTAGSGAVVVETLTGNSGGPVGPDAAFNINIVGNNTTGINVVGMPGANTLTIVGIQATTTQRGTVTLATNAETIAGTDTSKVLTPDDLSAKLGAQTLHGLPIGAGSTAALTWTAAPTDGQLLIGNTGNDPTLGNITSLGGSITITNGPGTINLEAASITGIVKIAVDADTPPGTNPVLPDGAGSIFITGNQVAAGAVGASVIRTDSLNSNEFTIEIQRSTAVAATDVTKNGVAHFNSSDFSVDANGFVQLNGGGIAATSFDVQANTAPGTDPVVPTALGVVTVNGAAVANHSVVLETRSRAANAYNLEVQYAASAAATDATKSGVAHFNSSDFSVDASGFVSAASTGYIRTITGTSGGAESPAAGGNFNILGGTAAAGTTPVVVAGTANTETVKVQISQSIAATDATKIGLANFDSALFTVDANGFVSGSGTGFIKTVTGTSGGALSPTAGNITLHAATVVAGTTPAAFAGSVSTETLNLQFSQAIASTDATKVGLANFDSAAFDVDANGFVQLNGGGIAATSFDVQANTAPGTDPVVPTAAGVVTVNGAAVANHSVVLETRSRAANAYNLEVQYAASAATTDATKSGVAHFKTADFSVDANGFVTAAATGYIRTITGTSGGAESPASGGNFTFAGATASAGTTPVVVAGTANTETVKVQISQAIAATDATKVGLATFDSASFGVDANGFVTFTGGAGSGVTFTGDYGTTSSGTAQTITASIGTITGFAFTASGTTITLDFDMPAGVLGVNNVTLGSGNFGSSTAGCAGNTVVGASATGGSLSTGSNNFFGGYQSGGTISTGSSNVLIGTAVFSGGADSQTVVIGSTCGSSSGGSNNTYIGNIAGTGAGNNASGNNNINIGAPGTNSGGGTIEIGTNGTNTVCYIQGIDSGAGTTSAVFVDGTGLLGTTVSSRKYKENIKPLTDSSILALQPVSFNYKKSTDPTKASRTSKLQYGLIAEDVAQIFPELVQYKDGEPESVAYHLMPVLLLAEIKRLNARIEAMEKNLTKMTSK